MKRREFRLISGQGAGPSVEDITKRPAKRRHFKTLQVGGQSTANRIAAVTLKGIDKTDGTTTWEYGPGSFWRHHYGVDAISGVVPNTSAMLNKYAICAGVYPAFNLCGNRNAASLTPNVMEAVSVVKLDSTDGSTIESATLTGMFCSDVRPESFALILGLTIDNAAALSGGDYVIVGQRLPIIEFVDYSSNTVNKEYILHAHGQQSGNVYLKTRTSNETITIPQNATAGEVETLFEATSDCVAATATGGPWPLVPIAIDVEWSVSGGDIASISATDTYTAEGLSVDYDFTDFYSGGTNTYVSTLTVNIVIVGSQWSFQFDGTGVEDPSSTFTYTAASADANTFVAALSSAFQAYATAHNTEAAWADVEVPFTADNQMAAEYEFDNRFLRLTVTGGSGVTDSRRAGSCAAAYDTGTGGMTSAVGYSFGYSVDRPTLKMFSETAALLSVTGLNILGISAIGSGPSDTVVVTPAARGTGDGTKANVVEKWSISGGVWTFGWQTYCNASMAMPQIIPCESGYVICPIGAKLFDAARYRTAARIAVSDTTTVELETTYGSITSGNNNVLTQMFDETPGSYFSHSYDITYQDPDRTNNRFRINGHGADTWISGSELRLGGQAFGCDSTQVYATYTGAVSRFNYKPAASMSHTFTVTFYPNHTARSAEPQQFRFVFDNMAGTNYTAWLDWYSTESEIETALDALHGSGNCSLIDFGPGLEQVENNPVALIEHNLVVQFLTDYGFSPGSGYIPQGYLSTTVGRVRIETQTATAFASPAGLAAYDKTDASLGWARAWGTKGATTINQPLYAWLQGGFVYAYGNVVDSDF